MKNLKKSLIILTLIFSMLLLFTSCGSSEYEVPDEYNYDDLSKYIKLADYKGIEYEEQKVSNEKITSGVAAEDCIVNIDYVGSVDGKEFDGGSAEGYDLDLDNSNFIDGFAEAIIGHSVGENFDIDVTFPEEYSNADLAGKPAVFNITINYMKKGPQSEAEAESLNKQAVFNQIAESSKVLEYPKAELESKEKTQIQQELVLYSIARAESIELNSAGYKEYCETLLKNAGVSEKNFEAQTGMSLADYAKQSGMFTSYLYDKVMSKIMEYSVAK